MIIVTEGNKICCFLAENKSTFPRSSWGSNQYQYLQHITLAYDNTKSRSIIQLVNTEYDTEAQRYAVPLARIFRMMVVDV